MSDVSDTLPGTGVPAACRMLLFWPSGRRFFRVFAQRVYPKNARLKICPLSVRIASAFYSRMNAMMYEARELWEIYGWLG